MPGSSRSRQPAPPAPAPTTARAPAPTAADLDPASPGNQEILRRVAEESTGPVNPHPTLDAVRPRPPIPA